MRFCRALVTLLLPALLLARAASGEDPEPASAPWTRIESSEALGEYQAKLKKKDGFDDAAQGFLEATILPQLAAERNRSSIERIRRRIRELALSERDADEGSLEKANDTAARGLTAMARNDKLDPLVRINAMLLVGELRSRDAGPWPAAATTLATAAADATLPMFVRVAAMAGLAKHAEPARATGSVNPAFQGTVVEKLSAILAAPPKPEDGAGGEWLLSRALEIVPLAVATATPETAKHVSAILGNPSRPTDVRVRAAAALADTASADSAIDAAGVVATIHRCAIAALEADLAATEDRAFGRRLGGPATAGQPVPSGLPGRPETGKPAGDEATVDPLVVRRDAWRLATLANAVQPAEGGGLAALIPAAERDVPADIAKALRTAANSLEQSGDTATLRKALEALAKVGQPAAAEKPGAVPGKPAANSPPASDPFATPGS